MDSLDVMREAEIRALDLLGRELPDALSRLVGLAATATGAEHAELNLVTTTSLHTLVSANGPVGRRDVGASFCGAIVREPPRTQLVPDSRLDDRFRHLRLSRDGTVVTYAAAPLVTSGGVSIGSLCVYDAEVKQIDQSRLDELTELAFVAMDLLEARRMQEEMREALLGLATDHQELRRSNEHLAAFAGQVSHDVQGPLAAVLMALQLLEEEGEQTPTTRMLLDRALSASQRMRATVTGLMDFAVVGGTLTPMRLEMEAVVGDVLDDLMARTGGADIKMGRLPVVWGDDVQLRAVTQNLLANAVKHGGQRPDSVIRVEGSTRRGYTEITVADNGPGVPQAERRRIFELLARGSEATRSGAGGLGIGLATCRRIIDAHGGEIGVRESPEGGAEFWFTLPLPSPEPV